MTKYEREALQAAANAADDAYSAELVRAYGERNAGDARYRMKHADRAVSRARLAKLDADCALYKAGAA